MNSHDELEARLAALSPRQRQLVEDMLGEDEQGRLDEPIRPRSPGTDRVPVSYEQERLWFMDRLVPYREAYYVPTALRLRGGLDTEAFSRALNGVVRRHEVLRTIFEEGEESILQVIQDHIEIPVPVEDVSGATDPLARARELGSATILEPFDLQVGPLLRARIYRLSSEDHIFVLTQHHIISDYWSLGIFLQELGQLYAKEIEVQTKPLPAPQLQYGDFAHWQRSTPQDKAQETSVQFWHRHLEGAPEVIDLPTDRPRPALRSSRGRFFPVRFEPSLVDRVRELAQQEGATMHVTLLSSYVATLSRYVRQEDIVVGVPVARRGRSEVQDLIGYFLNWLPIRVKLAGRPSLRELIRRTIKASTAAFAHQDLPFEILVHELQPRRHLGTTPVFQTSFSLRDEAPLPPSLPGLDVGFADLEGGASHFDLMAELWGEDGAVVGNFPYNEELFDEETIAQLVRHMTALLEVATQQPDIPVAALPMLDSRERESLLRRPTGDCGPTRASLHEVFSEQAARYPEHIAVVFEDRELSYRELDQRSNRLAWTLKHSGVGTEHMVGICLERSEEIIVAMLAILKTGGAYVPLEPDHPPQRLATQLTASGAVALITRSNLAERMPTGMLSTVYLDQDADRIAAESCANPANVTDPESAAYVIYTSGSTGTPKGVVATHANVIRLFEATEELIDTGPEDVWTLFHSYAFDFSVWEIWGALLRGGCLVVVPHWITRAPDAFAELLDDQQVTVLSSTPSMFAQLSREMVDTDAPLSELRYVVFGGEVLDPSMLRPWLERYGSRSPRLINMYGITETTVHVTHRPMRGEDIHRGSLSMIGHPLPDLALYVLDSELEPVPRGVPGELYVGGAGVTRGYIGAPRTTAERFIPDPHTGVPGARMYRTGDLARLLLGDELAYLGRIDDQVKVRGYRIELGEVQAALGRVEGIVESVVIAREDDTDNLHLVAYVVVEDGSVATQTRLRRALLSELPDYMVPATFVALDALPLTVNGKVDRQALPMPTSQSKQESSYVAPQTEIEQQLAKIWTEVLDSEQVGLNDNFFELGGHSLMVVQLGSRIRESMGVEMPIATLFQTPELEGMAQALSSTGTDGAVDIAVDEEAMLAGLSEAEIDAMLGSLEGESAEPAPDPSIGDQPRFDHSHTPGTDT